MSDLEYCLLTNITRLEMAANNDSGPEEMGIDEERISTYAAFIEQNSKTVEDYRKQTSVTIDFLKIHFIKMEDLCIIKN